MCSTRATHRLGQGGGLGEEVEVSQRKGQLRGLLHLDHLQQRNGEDNNGVNVKWLAFPTLDPSRILQAVNSRMA